MNNEYFRFKDEEEWKEYHKKPINGMISVTQFLTLCGITSYSRKILLGKSIEEEEGTYGKLCIEHGTKYEPECIEKMKNYLPNLEIETPQRVCRVNNDGLYGTSDAYFLHKETGDFGIIEIKCPFGSKYGWFDEYQLESEDISNTRSQSKISNWYQLQYYLALHGYDIGILAYYYPRNKILILYQVKRTNIALEEYQFFMNIYKNHWEEATEDIKKGKRKNIFGKKGKYFIDPTTIMHRRLIRV